jgi:hypothetical protein
MTVLDRPITTRPAYRALGAGVGLGVLGALLEAGIGTFGPTPSGTEPYTHASQYWFVASALPTAAGAIIVLFAVRQLQRGRDGRLGLAGIGLATVCLLVLAGICAASVAVGHDIQGGPTYVLGTLGSLVGVALFAAGSWRVGAVPRWLLAIWPIVWVIGSFAAVSASPLLLVALYAALLVALRER